MKQLTRFLFFSILMLLILAVPFTGCNRKADKDKKTETKETTKNEETANDKEPADNKEPTDDKETADNKEPANDKYTDHFPDIDYSKMTFSEFTKSLTQQIAGMDALYCNSLLHDPIAYGLKEIPDTLRTIDAETILAEHEFYVRINNALKNFKFEDLDPEQQLTYKLLEFESGIAVQEDPNVYFNDPLGPFYGAQAQLPINLTQYNFYDKSYIDRYLNVLKSTSDYFDSICEHEKLLSEKGYFMSDDMADKVIEQCQTFIDSDPNILIINFNERIDNYAGLTDEERTDYKARNNDIFKNHVIPSYKKIISTLTELKGTGKNNTGLAGFEGGKEEYALIVKNKYGHDITVEELEKEIDNAISRELISLNALVLFNTELVDIESDIFKSKITDPEEIINMLKKNMSNDFKALDDVEYEIDYVDKALEDYLSPAMYFLPAIDSEDIQRIFINKKGTASETQMFSTLAHEGFPGHLYQFVISTRNHDDPVRRIFSSDSLSEGWATYVEMKSFFYGDLDYKAAQFLEINRRLGLLIMAKMDIGVHYNGWTIKELGEYLEPYYELNEDNLKDQFLMIVENPGNVLGYICGCMGYEDLEKYAMEELGDDFKMIEFTDFVVNKGFVPFDTFKELLDKEFIPSQRTGAAA